MCSFDANYADWEEVFTSLSISRAILSLGTGFPLKNSKTNIRIDIFWSRCHRCRVSRFDYSSVEGYGCKISRDIVSARTHRNCIAKNDRADGFMEKSLSLSVFPYLTFYVFARRHAVIIIDTVLPYFSTTVCCKRLLVKAWFYDGKWSRIIWNCYWTNITRKESWKERLLTLSKPRYLLLSTKLKSVINWLIIRIRGKGTFHDSIQLLAAHRLTNQPGRIHKTRASFRCTKSGVGASDRERVDGASCRNLRL